MPNYYLTVETAEHWKRPWSEPPTHGFAEKYAKYAQKFRLGDRVVGYVKEWGFATVMEVDAWNDARLPYRYDSATSPEYPWRVKVRVLCEIEEKDIMPKWQKLRPYLKWCKGMSAQGAGGTLQTSLKQIEKHDFDLIAIAVFSARIGAPWQEIIPCLA